MIGVDSIVCDATDETISFLFKQFKKEKNKQKIDKIIEHVVSIAMKSVQPYLWTIMGILLIMFCTSLLQFYYYLKAFITNKGSLETLTNQMA